MPGRVSSPTFVGRDEEMVALEGALSAAAQAKATAVLIGGEAGVGKTRLTTEFSRRAADAGTTVLFGACVSVGESGLPHAPIVEALHSLVRSLGAPAAQALAGPAGAELGRLVPELARGPVESVTALYEPDWTQARLFEAILGLLRRLGERAPVLLIIEDLHWADRSTRDLLSYLVRSVRDERLLLCGTFRSDELHRRHPLLPWLAEMERTGLVERLDLARFGAAELAAQLEGILGAPPTPQLLDEMLRRSDGNAFYAEELLAARASGERLPATLREVVLSRVASLPDPVQRVLGVAAVGGRRVPHSVLAEVGDASAEDLLERVSAAVANQLLVAGSDGGEDFYDFRHALVQEAVYEDLLPHERRRLHAAYARVLDGSPLSAGAEGASRLAQLAHHWSAAQELPRALVASLAAARAARDSYAFAESARQYERAIELWDVVPEPAELSGIDHVALLHEASEPMELAGDIDRATEVAREAAEAFDPATDPRRGAMLLERYARSLWVAGRSEESIKVRRRAAALLTDEPASYERAFVSAALASGLMLKALYRESISVAEEAISIARQVGATDQEAHAMNTLGVDLASIGDCERAIPLLREAKAMTERLGRVNDIGRSYANLASALDICGDDEGALAMSFEGAEVSERLGVGSTYGGFHQLNAVDTLTIVGRWDEADAIIRRQAALAPAGGVVRMHLVTSAAPLWVGQGRFAEARAGLAELGALLEHSREAQWFGPYFIALAELEMLEGNVDAARRAVDEGLGLLHASDDHRFVAQLLRVSLAVEAEAAEQARARGDKEGTRRARTRARAVAEELRATALPDDPEREGRPRLRELAAEAELSRIDGRPDAQLWKTIGEQLEQRNRPYAAAQARRRQAEALLSRGDREAAREPLRTAHAVAVRLGAQPLRSSVEGLAAAARIRLEPAVEPRQLADEQPADPFGLTRREREVLGLVAEGRTNREIAESLFISESTAGVHVSNILGKLGVSGRTEAATTAVRLGLVQTPASSERVH